MLSCGSCPASCHWKPPIIPLPTPTTLPAPCSEKLDVLDHYVAWRQTHDMPQHASGTDGPFSFCSYPFLLNPRAKSKLLHTEARIQMDQTVAQSRLEQQSANNNGSLSARGQRRVDEEECVVPNEKARLSSALRNSGEGGPGSSGRAHAAGPARRRDRHGGLRWLFNSLRTNDGPQPSAGSTLQVRQRAGEGESTACNCWFAGT